MVFVWMMTAVSPRVRERLSVVMVRVTLHEVSPNAMAMAVAMDTTRYLIAFLSRSFCISVNCFIGFGVLKITLTGFGLQQPKQLYFNNNSVGAQHTPTAGIVFIVGFSLLVLSKYIFP